MNSVKSKLLLGALIIVCFQNCGQQVGFSEAPSVKDVPVTGSGDEDDTSGGVNVDLDGPEDEDIDVINKKCNNTVQQTANVTLTFPKPNQTCDFGNNGNLSRLNQYLRARIEQKQNLNLPANAVICDAQFEFPIQNFLYDDQFIVLFNKSIITASYDFEGIFEEKNFGLLEYDWAKIANNGAGTFWDTSKETVFCPQIAGSMAHCSFPDTDVAGTIELEYDSKYIRSIMSNGVPSNHSFSVISIGDNDDLDCEHSDLTFTVQVKYVK